MFCFRPEGYARYWVNDDSTRYEYLLSLNGVHADELSGADKHSKAGADQA